jgi:MarR family transcriptional regulator, organic hydroperoxide resistance regulator
MEENRRMPEVRMARNAYNKPAGSPEAISEPIDSTAGGMPPAGNRNGTRQPDGKSAGDMLLLDNQLCFAAYALSREIIGLYRPYLDILGITYTQYITLLVLWESRELSMKALGERLFLDSGTLTPLLKKLSRLGLVEKERDADDERSVIVRLTGEGWRMRDKVADLPLKILCETGLDAGTVAGLRDRMKQLSVSMRESCKQENSRNS